MSEVFLQAGFKTVKLGLSRDGEKRDFTRRMMEDAERIIPGVRSKRLLDQYLEHPSGYVRSFAIRQLGEVCFGKKDWKARKEGRDVSDYDYIQFAKALFEDPSFMVGQEAVKALARDAGPVAVSLLLQAICCDVGQVADEAEKAVEMIMKRGWDSSVLVMRAERTLPDDIRRKVRAAWGNGKEEFAEAGTEIGE